MAHTWVAALVGLALLLPVLWCLFRVFKGRQATQPRTTVAEFADSLVSQSVSEDTDAAP